MTGTRRWTAPEVYTPLRSLLIWVQVGDRKFGPKADMYSFGLVMWSMLAGTTEPYPSLNDLQVDTAVAVGFREAFPSHTLPSVVKLISAAWDPHPHLRPDFQMLLDQLWVLQDAQTGRYYCRIWDDVPDTLLLLIAQHVSLHLFLTSPKKLSRKCRQSWASTSRRFDFLLNSYKSLPAFEKRWSCSESRKKSARGKPLLDEGAVKYDTTRQAIEISLEESYPLTPEGVTDDKEDETEAKVKITLDSPPLSIPLIPLQASAPFAYRITPPNSPRTSSPTTPEMKATLSPLSASSPSPSEHVGTTVFKSEDVIKSRSRSNSGSGAALSLKSSTSFLHKYLYSPRSMFASPFPNTHHVEVTRLYLPPQILPLPSRQHPPSSPCFTRAKLQAVL